MSYTTVRITSAARDTLRDLARARGRSMQALLDEAIEGLRRRVFLERVNQAFAELRRDDGAWAAVEAERAAWDGTLLDGLTAADRPAPRRPRTRRRSRRSRA